MTIAFALPTLGGWGLLSVWLGDHVASHERHGLSYLAGTGLVYAVFFFASVLVGPPAAMWTVALVLVLCWVAAVKKRSRTTREAQPWLEGVPAQMAAVYVAAIGCMVLLRALLRTVTVVDCIGIWAVKARHLHMFGLDGRLFESGYFHPSYPLFIPVQGAWVAFAVGGWNDRLFCVVPVMLCASALWVFASHLRRIGNPTIALALVGLLSSCPALQVSVLQPMADVPLALLSGIGVVLLHRCLTLPSIHVFGLAGCFIGLGAVTKKEGTAFALVVVVLAALVAKLSARGWTLFAKQWLAFVVGASTLPLGWQTYLLAHDIRLGFTADAATSIRPEALATAVERVLRYMWANGAMGRGSDVGSWLLLLPTAIIVVLVMPGVTMRSGAWLFLSGAVGVLICNLVGVVASPFPFEALLVSAVDRLTTQLMPLAFLAVGTAVSASLTSDCSPQRS